MALNVETSKGLSVNLTKNSNGKLSKIRIEAGWDAGDDFDLDLIGCLMKKVGNQNKLLAIEDIVSPYDFSKVLKQNDGTVRSLCGSVIYHGDNRVGNSISNSGNVCETITADLKSLSDNGYTGLRLAVNLFNGVDKKQVLGSVKNAFVRVINEDTNEIIGNANIDMTKEHTFDISVDVGEIYLQNGEWSFVNNDQGYNKEVNHLINIIS